MLGKIKTAVELLQEKWRESRIPANDAIFSGLREYVDESIGKREGILRYLEDYSPIGEIQCKRDWHRDEGSGEMRLDYTNTLFAPGSLRFIPGQKARPIIVYLPGNLTGAQAVLGTKNHPQYMVETAKKLGYGIACWDWPLQGLRRSRGLYEGFQTIYSIEREYSRILPALGTCLWREMVAELQYVLDQLVQLTSGQSEFKVIGWSMGASFAYITPLLSRQVRSVIAAGSCASIRDLLDNGESRAHGYFFYPLNGIAYFDLENTVEKVLASEDCRLKIIFGDRDPGCFFSTARVLSSNALKAGHRLELSILSNHGHKLSSRIKGEITDFISVD